MCEVMLPAWVGYVMLGAVLVILCAVAMFLVLAVIIFARLVVDEWKTF